MKIAEKKPKICIIAALEESSRAIGKNNKLLWKIPDDMARFKKLTTGHTVIMGRKTYQSIGRPLPDRNNIVVSNTLSHIPKASVSSSLESAFRLARSLKKKIFVIGGERLYEEALKYSSILYLTLVRDPKANGDVFFPHYEHLFKEVSRTKETQNGGISFCYANFRKI